MSRRRISVEVFRDIETPGISIDDAIEGLEKVRSIVEPLEIVARSGLLRVSKHGSLTIPSNQIPPLDIQTDFGIILTGRPIVMPMHHQMPIHEGNITIGLTTHRQNASDFALIDAVRTNSLINSTMHETGHLFGVPNSGENFDGKCHCLRSDCLMHGELKEIQTDYCIDCREQLSQSPDFIP